MVRLLGVVLLIATIHGPAAARSLAEADRDTALYRTLLVRAEPGRLLDLIQAFRQATQASIIFRGR